MTGRRTQMWTDAELDTALTELAPSEPVTDAELSSARARVLATLADGPVDRSAVDQDPTELPWPAAPHRPRRRLAVTLVAAAAAVLLASAVGTVIAVHRPAAGGPAQPQRTTSASPTSPAQYPTVSGVVEIYLQVPATQVPADGRSFDVSVVIVNGLGSSFNVSGACSGWLEAGLDSAAIPLHLGMPSVLCPPDTVGPGTTHLTRTVRTTYSACSSGAVVAAVAAWSPACAGPQHNEVPNLPPGAYNLKLYTSEIPHAVIHDPITITLTAP